jgi:hypothetical protein
MHATLAEGNTPKSKRFDWQQSVAEIEALYKELAGSV